jgi:acyl-CoA thioester hydrolase
VASCRYASPARYDDEVRIRTEIDQANYRMVTFTYEMVVGERKVATGFSRHIFLARDFRPTRLPEKYLRLFGIEKKGG